MTEKIVKGGCDHSDEAVEHSGVISGVCFVIMIVALPIAAFVC